jgi:hypothetical protein
MNEKIKELAKQTGYVWHASGEPQVYEFSPEKLEKFALAIVDECCNRMSHETISHSGYGYNQHALYQILREHFGVQQ